jgi:cytoskeletal protein CcmA (bactofilin family)
VVLGSKARVRGNVHYGVIEMALGAEISGKLVPAGDRPGHVSVASEPAEEQAENAA